MKKSKKKKKSSFDPVNTFCSPDFWVPSPLKPQVALDIEQTRLSAVVSMFCICVCVYAKALQARFI